MEWTSKSVSELNLPRVAVLDFVEHAKVEFSTADKNNFDYLLFGGILGESFEMKNPHSHSHSQRLEWVPSCILRATDDNL